MATQYDPCEPFRAYNRLEGRPRQEELDDALAAKIHDPLWMLARQYQFGEFKGEDAGSAIFAKVALNTVRMTEFVNGNSVQSMPENLPLETVVESLAIEIDQKMALRLGKKFLQLFDEIGLSATQNPPYAIGQYKQSFINKFKFEVKQISKTQNASVAMANAREKSLQESEALVRALEGKALNGKALWQYLNGNPNNIGQTVLPLNGIASLLKFIDFGHTNLALEVALQWLNFVKAEFNIPQNQNTDCWHPEKLEYAFASNVTEANGGKTKLSAQEYYNGHLDWFSFDVEKPNPNLSNASDGTIGKREVLSVIPTQASFAGMPNARWWEMEDGTIDLGNLKANDTDIAKILVSQYALQYSNDWLIVPYSLPTGSFTEVEGIVVTDTFGRKVLVESAQKADAADWNNWNMYSISVQKGTFENPDYDRRLLLPPAIAKVHESNPVEEVKFIKDEMANMVWGIESIVPNGLGAGIDGYEAAKNLEAVLATLIEPKLIPENLTLPPVVLGSQQLRANTYKPQLKYMLGNSVSENWIPFIASHKQGSYREINFQRASMPRIVDAFAPHAIRPRTQLLRQGVAENDNQITPYFINEEEIPRAGVRVTGTYQRTRWYNGKVVTWFGRRKYTGRGEGSSGLRFDLLLDND